MANVIQLATAPIDFRTFQTPGRRRKVGEPMGMLVHTQDAFAFDDIGVGDTGGLRLALPLTAGYGFRFYQAWAQTFGSTGSHTQWRDPGITVFYSPIQGIDPGQTTQLQIPMCTDVHVDPGAISTNRFMVGGDETIGGGGDSSAQMAQQFNLVLYGTDSTDPSFELHCPNASTADKTFSYTFNWLVFDIQECLGSELYYQLPVRT